MKKAMLLGSILLLCTAALFAQSGPVISIENKTGVDIYHIYISSAGVDNWEEDLLGDDVLENGETLECKLPHGGKWDFMAEDEKGGTYQLMGISVPGTNKLVLTKS
jgi:hypothetical protein